MPPSPRPASPSRANSPLLNTENVSNILAADDDELALAQSMEKEEEEEDHDSSYETSVSHTNTYPSASTSNTLSLPAPIRLPIVSPEPTYKINGTAHYSSGPMSARDRSRLEEERKHSAEQQQQSQRYSPNPSSNTNIGNSSPSSHSAAAPSSVRLSSEASLQRQMLNESLNVHPAGDNSIHHHPIQVMEIEDDEDFSQQRQHKFPIKSTIIALFLLCVGITCLIIGLIHIITGSDTVFAFLLIGALLILPGGYQCRIIWKAYRRVPGFSFAQLSAYEG